jgi:hypothetical protein
VGDVNMNPNVFDFTVLDAFCYPFYPGGIGIRNVDARRLAKLYDGSFSDSKQ